MSNAERNRTILARRVKGETYRALAAEYGISVERVRQIVYNTLRVLDRAVMSPEEVLARKAEERAAREAEHIEHARLRREEKLRAQAEARRVFEQRARAELARTVQLLKPRWRELNELGWWLQSRGQMPTGTYYGTTEQNRIPAYVQAITILDAWVEGRANETATVGRLRRLMDEGTMPEGLAA